MKKHLPSFLSGMLTMALICAFVIPVLAFAGMTITVDPINIQVKGQVFQPKDVNGNDVPVFAYNGTTYAPLRALATAYGLEVGYDSGTNMATVSEPGEPTPAAPSNDYSNYTIETYDDYKRLWSIEKWEHTPVENVYSGYYNGNMTSKQLFNIISKLGEAKRMDYAEKLAREIMLNYSLEFIHFSTCTGQMRYEAISIENGKVTGAECVTELPKSLQ